jgi:hypothetical protein
MTLEDVHQTFEREISFENYTDLNYEVEGTNTES